MASKTCGECKYYKPYNEKICLYVHRSCVSPKTKACNSFAKPTLFDRLTQSPEVLARKVVYPVFDYGNSIAVKIRGYKSPFLNDIYPTWDLAFEKTVAKLKEVEK